MTFTAVSSFARTVAIRRSHCRAWSNNARVSAAASAEVLIFLEVETQP
jgi:hypothetical protein